MSRFDTLFLNYPTTEAYIAARDILIKKGENAPLLAGSASAGRYGIGLAYTIGYGYDISQQTNGNTIKADFAKAGIALPANVLTLLPNFKTGNSTTTLAMLDNAFRNTGIVGQPIFTLSESQATELMHAVVPKYDNFVANAANVQRSYTVNGVQTTGNALSNGITLGNTGLHALLVSEDYNNPTIFGSNQATAIAADNTDNFLYDALFKNTVANGGYDKGIENRRIRDLSAALGIVEGSSDGENRITNINFNGNVIAAVDIYRALRANAANISATIAGYATGTDGYVQLSQLNTNLLASSQALLGATGTGFYVVQSGDTKASIYADTALLDRLNGSTAFPDGDFVVGSVMRVPLSSVSVNTSPTIIAAASKYQVLAYDPATSKIYTTGTSLDHNGYGQVINTSTGQAMTILSADAVITATETATNTLKITGGSSLVANPTFTAIMDSTQISLAGNLNVKATTDINQQVRTQITATSLKNDGLIDVGSNSFLKIAAPISSNLLSAITNTIVGVSSVSNITSLVGASGGSNKWSGSASAATGSATIRGISYGTMSDQFYVDDLNYPVFSNPNIRSSGAPFYTEGFLIKGTAAQNVTAGSETITYTFDNPLPVGTKFYLVDPGTYASVTDPVTHVTTTVNSADFTFSASLNTGSGSNPVSGAFSFSSVNPYALPTLANYAFNTSTGKVTVTNGQNIYEANNHFVDNIVVATTTSEITSLTVSALTPAYDSWGLFFDVRKPGIKLESGASVELTGSVDNSQQIIFNAAGNEVLTIDDPANFSATISNFSFGDKITLRMRTPGQSVIMTHSVDNRFTNTWSLLNTATNVAASIKLARNEDYSGANIVLDANSAPDSVSLVFAGYVYNGSNAVNILNGSAGDDLFNGGGGADTINGGDGRDTITFGNMSGATSFTGAIANGGAGDDTIVFRPSAGTPAFTGISVDGGAGNNTIQAFGANISGVTIANATTLDIASDRQVTLTAVQLSNFSTITAQYNSQDPLSAYIYAASAGTYNLQGKDISVAHTLNLVGSSGDDTLIGTSHGTSDPLSSIDGGAGNDTIYAGVLSTDNVYGGSGNDTVVINTATYSSLRYNSTIDGGTGVNILKTTGLDSNHGGIYVANVSNFQTLDVVDGVIALTNTQLAGFTNLVAETGSAVIQAIVAGNYDISSKTVTGVFNLDASMNSSANTLVGNSAAQTLTGGAGNDVLIGGLGADIMYGGSGDDEFLVGGTEVVAGEIMDGGTGLNEVNTWNTNLSLATLTNVQSLVVHLTDVTLSSAQIANFTTLLAVDGAVTLTASNAGTYSLDGKAVTGAFSMVGSSGADYLAGNGANQTLNGGDGNDMIQGVGGVDTLLGGNGNDEFLIGGNEAAAGSVVDGGAGVNRISSWNVDLSGVAVSNVQVLGLNLATAKLTAAQFAGLTTIENNSGATATITAATTGTYTLDDKAVTGAISIIGTSGNDYLGGNGASQTLSGGDGNDQIQGLGGVDALLGGNGDDEFLIGGTEAATGSVVDGGAGVNKISSWNVDLTGVTVSNIQSLSLNLPLATLTVAQFSGLTTIVNNSGSTGTITAATAGTYSFAGKTITGAINLTGSSGNDTLIGNAAAQTISGAAGNDTLDGAGGIDVLQGGIGNDTYKFGLGYGSDTIADNDSTAGNTDILSFASGTARDQIWFSQSGNDLLVRIIGTTDQMTISGWYNGSANHVEQLKTSANNVLLDSQVQNLVNAMAGMTFPTTTTLTAQQHTQLDSVIAANWT